MLQSDCVHLSISDNFAQAVALISSKEADFDPSAAMFESQSGRN